MIFAFQTHSRRQKSFRSTISCIFALSCYLVLFAHFSYAQENSGNNTNNQSNDFSLQPLMQLPVSTKKNNEWRQFIAHPVNPQQYYASNKQGEIYLIEQKKKENTAVNASLLLDLNQLTLTSNTVKTLNTFTLHPNFSLKDQQGFLTFYTAHTEASNKNSATKRIQERHAKLSMAFDGVITEWQLDLSNPSQIDLNKTREVLRITIPDAKHGIKQLSFNPYIKPWNDNFALLYIALESSDSLSQFPLYSGAILRINPKKFGMRSFTVPDNNPFLKNNKINNSFYLVGAQHIQQFLWPDKNSEQLLISHQYQSNNKQSKNSQSYQWLSYSQGGEDWREQAPQHALYKSHKKIHSNQILLYRGRNAPTLHNKLLLLQKNEKEWRLNSLNHSQEISQVGQKTVIPKVEWQLNNPLSTAKALQLRINKNAELILLQQQTGEAFELFQDNVPFNKIDNKSSTAPIYFFLIIMFASMTWYGFYQLKVNKKSAKAMVRKQYAHISLDKEKQILNLFKRHQKTIEKSIPIADITLCQVLLGDDVIASIDHEVEQGFSDEQEQALRDVFNREHTEKMIDGKIRRISINITDHKDSYITCLYLRKGNDRITKRSYYQVIDDLIDWCWLIAKKINAENTSTRKARPKISAAEKSKSEHKLHDETPLHKQAAIIRPVTHQQAKQQSSESIASKANDEIITPKVSRSSDKEVNPENSVSAGLVDTELVNALEKLVKLKQQGFLDAEEFAQAKAKLLKNLIA